MSIGEKHVKEPVSEVHNIEEEESEETGDDLDDYDDDDGDDDEYDSDLQGEIFSDDDNPLDDVPDIIFLTVAFTQGQTLYGEVNHTVEGIELSGLLYDKLMVDDAPPWPLDPYILAEFQKGKTRFFINLLDDSNHFYVTILIDLYTTNQWGKDFLQKVMYRYINFHGMMAKNALEWDESNLDEKNTVMALSEQTGYEKVYFVKRDASPEFHVIGEVISGYAKLATASQVILAEHQLWVVDIGMIV